jgi:uncharacterized membrane protein YsdA (DUF1294 family)
MQNFSLFIVAYLLVANVLSFALVALDKNKSISRHKRIPEVYFFFWSLFFSSLGTLIGVFVFRHKTRKIYFPIGIALILIGQLLLAFFLYTRGF